MNLKKLKIINIIGTFIITFPFHFAYTVFPNKIFAIFFPVNESIWEHMKLLTTSILIWSFVEFFIIKKFKLLYHNFIILSIFSAIFAIPLFLIMFLPIYYLYGHHLIISLIIMFITFVIVISIKYSLPNTKSIRYEKIISLLIITVLYYIFGYLTYNPLINDLFFDHMDNKYGINTYLIGNGK